MPILLIRRVILLAAMVVSLGASGGAIATPATPVTVDCSSAKAYGLLVTANVDGLSIRDVTSGAVTADLPLGSVTSLWPTALPTHALALASDGLHVIDAPAGSATLLEIDPEIAATLAPNPGLTRGEAGRERMVLADPATNVAYLIDLPMGQATDLAALLPNRPKGAGFIGQITVTAGDAAVLIWDGQQVYLVDAADPTSAQPVGGVGAFTYGPDAASDGSAFAYGRRTVDGGSEIVVQPLDGSAETVVHTSKDAAIPLWIPGRNALLIDERSMTDGSGSIIYLDLDAARETPLVSYTGAIMAIQFTPDGGFGLIGVDKPGNRQWYRIAFDDLSPQLIPDAASLHALPGLYGDAAWTFFAPAPVGGPGVDNFGYAGMNLADGTYVPLAMQSSAQTYSTPTLSPDASRALVVSSDAGQETLWLMDSVAESAKEVATGSAISAAFDPTGCFVAGVVDGVVFTVAVTDGTSVDLGEGDQVLWRAS